MKITDLTENDVIQVNSLKEFNKTISLLKKHFGFKFINGNKNTIRTIINIGFENCIVIYVTDRQWDYLEDVGEGYNIIPASKFLKPSLKKRVKELEKWRKSFEQPKTANGIEVHFDEVERLPEYKRIKCDFIGKNVEVTLGHELNEKTLTGVLKEFMPISQGAWCVLDVAGKEESFASDLIRVKLIEPKPVELEVGKWYRQEIYEGKNTLFFYNGRIGNEATYGFNTNGEWSEKIGIHFDNDPITPATATEVFEALKAEAERRGFKDGVKINSFITQGYTLSNTAPFTMTTEKYTGVEDKYSLRFGGSCIYTNGKWAEIIDQPTAIDWSKAGQLVKSENVVVMTTGEHIDSMFSGYALTDTHYEKGQFESDWDKKIFTLCTEPVTLKN